MMILYIYTHTKRLLYFVCSLYIILFVLNFTLTQYQKIKKKIFCRSFALDYDYSCINTNVLYTVYINIYIYY